MHASRDHRVVAGDQGVSRYKPYPKYKPSGVEWLGDVPEHWEVSKLKYVLLTIIAGGTPKTDNSANWCESGEGIPWVSIADMSESNIIIKTKKDVTTSGIAEKGLKILPKGTLLYSIFASLGKVAIANVELTTNQAILGLIPNKKIANEFLYWLLISLEKYVHFIASSNTQDNLNMEKVANFPIPFLPTNEQTAIANFLDRETAKIDTLISKQERLIELLQEKRQALISHAVTKGLDPNVKMKDSGVAWLSEVPEHWEVKRLKFNLKTRAKKANLEGRKVIALENIESGTGKYIPTETKYEGEDVACYRNDILFGKLRPYLAKVYKCDEDAIAFGDLIAFQPLSNMNSAYAFYMMISKNFIKTVDSSTYGAKMPRASVDFISEMSVPTPPLQEQQQIADYLDTQTAKIDTLIEKAHQAITLLKERREALISAAVTGKIDVRELN